MSRDQCGITGPGGHILSQDDMAALPMENLGFICAVCRGIVRGKKPAETGTKGGKGKQYKQSLHLKEMDPGRRGRGGITEIK